MSVYRSALLRFADDGRALYDEDGLLAIGPDAQGRQRVLAAGSWQALGSQYADQPVSHLPGRILAPGFVDMHIHFPQTDVIGSPADGLLPWLENYTFPHEKRFAAPDYSAQVAQFFIAELLRNGVTTALAFSTSHPASVNALFTEAQRQHLRLITGKVLQDRHSPDGVRDDTEQSLIDTEALIQRWHGVDRLGYAITPRFAPSCTGQQLRGAGGLAVTSGAVLVSDPAGTVWALDKYSGGALWSNTTLARRSLTAPTVHGDYAVVGDYDGYLHWMKTDNGEVVARARVGGKAVRGKPVVADGILLVQDVEGGLTAFGFK